MTNSDSESNGNPNSLPLMSTLMREREDSNSESRSSKRAKITELDDDHTVGERSQAERESNKAEESILPPSHVLLGLRSQSTTSDGLRQLLECDVGISEYVTHDLHPIRGIIKQRFTDFLVNEVDLDHRVVHIKSLGPPESKKDKNLSPVVAEERTDALAREAADIQVSDTTDQAGSSKIHQSDNTTSREEHESEAVPGDEVAWDDTFESLLSPFLSESSIIELKAMYLEGPEPPRVSDNGYAGRAHKGSDGAEVSTQDQDNEVHSSNARDGRDRNPRGGRGRQRGHSGRLQVNEREDHRKVLSEPFDSKATRTALHQVVRKLFRGKLESETDMSSPAGEGGSRIMIKWSRRGGGRGARRERAPRGEYPPYIHFTLQKTNRDTQDALAYLARTLHVNVKDLAVSGTKDKRGVTVQRVSLRRGKKTIDDVWKTANQIGRRSVREALTHRGERGVRIADLNYRKAGLELGMLKGNEFVITLRNVQVDSVDMLDLAVNNIKQKGFINYYGMQRFGTAAVPTHAIGLAFLQSDWHKAVSLILQIRPGEHPDVVAAREAWLVDRNLDRALALMPRRVVAERCILESYKKQGGETRNAMGALSTIPRNLRLMYIHAYQSYVWNAIVSERVRMHGADKVVPGDLVFEEELAGKEDVGDLLDVDPDEPVAIDEHGESGNTPKKIRKALWAPPKVKTLTTDDAHKHSITDVIMPLPGKDVEYPGGPLGERYREFLRRDGLDPDNFIRKQKEYTLHGSYRKLFQLPKDMSWSILRYTDPDVALAQADEDKLLGFDPPSVVENGKFMALQIHLTLGTAAYATMALRELTRTETSSHFQTELTQASEDQQFRGTAIPSADDAGEVIVECKGRP